MCSEGEVLTDRKQGKAESDDALLCMIIRKGAEFVSAPASFTDVMTSMTICSFIDTLAAARSRVAS